jgi:hypothetical protein
MKNKHIVNVGLPRCATTWVWHNILHHLDSDLDIYNKENPLLLNGSYSQYKDFYNQYTVSANFNPNLWHIDTDLIRYIDQYATHISIIFRNPYEFIERYCDWIKVPDPEQDVNFIIESKFVDYYEISARWKNNTTKKFNIFYFEDIVSDPKLFLLNYFDFCEFDCSVPSTFDKVVNQNPKTTKIKDKNLTVKNFMSVGNSTQAIDFDRQDLTLVLGENLDLGGDGSRNGTGKTTIINALSYALYGQALSNIRKDNLVNKTNGKTCWSVWILLWALKNTKSNVVASPMC